MDRREAVKSVAFLFGGALSATTIGVFLEGCNSPSTTGSKILFTADQEKILAELADIIIPATKTPGAKEAGVGPFIALMVKDCYPEDAQKAFVKGLEDLEKRSKDDYQKSFLELGAKEREELVGKFREETISGQKTDKEAEKAEEERLAKETTAQPKSEKENPGTNVEAAKVNTSKPKTEEKSGGYVLEAKIKKQAKPYFFAIARDLTILGYFTSEIGATQAYEYVEIPGRYDGCVDLKPGQRFYS